MRVVHICTNYNGGAGKAAFRLHNALLNDGVDSVFISLGQQPLIDVKGNKTVLLKWDFPFFVKLIIKLRKKLGLEHQYIIQLRELMPKLNYLTVSLPISNLRLHNIKEIQNADIINLHGVTHILDYKTFFRKMKKPIVWTLHDINPIAGIFHLRTDEVNNKILAHNFDVKVFKYKVAAYRNFKRGTIVAPSHWLYKESIKRQAFHKLVHYEIPNSIPDIYFNAIDRIRLKEQYKIPLDVVTLLFVSSDLSDKNKGFDLLLAALQLIEEAAIHLLIVGGGDQSVFQEYKNTAFGYVSEDAEMTSIYNLADIFVIPSRDENLPNVLLESLACGTPVVSFKIGGMVQYIQEGVNGELAKEVGSKSLGETLNKAIKNKNNYSRVDIKANALLNFKKNKQAAKYLEIYNSFY